MQLQGAEGERRVRETGYRYHRAAVLSGSGRILTQDISVAEVWRP